MRDAIATIPLAVISVAACRGTEPPAAPTFVVEVVAAPGANYRVYGVNLQGARDSSGSWVTSEPWPNVAMEEFDLTARSQDVITGRVTLRPFVCAGLSNFAKRLSEGWRAVETHQVFLTRAGALEVDTDFEHPLTYKCDWSPPDDLSHRDGASTFTAAPQLCTDASRRETRMALSGSVLGRKLQDLAPETCSAMLTDEGDGLIQLEFAAISAGARIDIVAKHCLGATEGAPITLDSSPDAGCRFRVLADAVDEVGNSESLPAKIGRWTISTVNFEKGGRITGLLAVQVSRGDDLVTIDGSYDLPFIRVPIENDWHR